MKKPNGKLSLKKSGKYYALIGLFIAAFAFAHFSMQLNFIQKENLRVIETAQENEISAPAPASPPRVIEVAPDLIEVKKVEVITVPEPVKTAPRARKETRKENPPRQRVVRKTEPRESRAERLRRAERILTGV
jgi:hypothetical protein